jgi:uncharacterized damage-inducible protein DinB
MRDHFIKVFQHLKWADARVLDSLRGAKSLLKKDQALFAHILGSEHVWLSRIGGTAPKLAIWPTLTLDECDQLASENAVAYQKLISSLTAKEMQRAITYRNSAGDEYTSMLGAYHRGQIAASVRAAGDAPSPTDYIAFARGAPAATSQR